LGVGTLKIFIVSQSGMIRGAALFVIPEQAHLSRRVPQAIERMREAMNVPVHRAVVDAAGDLAVRIDVSG